MKKTIYFILLILLYSNSSIGQNIELMGYLTYFENNDSSATLKEYHSKLILNEDKEEIYKEWIPFFLNSGPEIRFNFKIGGTDNICKGFVYGKDSTIYKYIHDTLSHKRYIIENEDTSFVYRTKYDEKNSFFNVIEAASLPFPV